MWGELRSHDCIEGRHDCEEQLCECWCHGELAEHRQTERLVEEIDWSIDNLRRSADWRWVPAALAWAALWALIVGDVLCR